MRNSRDHYDYWDRLETLDRLAAELCCRAPSAVFGAYMARGVVDRLRHESDRLRDDLNEAISELQALLGRYR